MEIVRDQKKKLYLSQEKYIDKVLERLNVKELKSVSTHLATHFRLSVLDSPKSKGKEDRMLQVPYSNVVGYIMYAIVYTCLDVTQAINGKTQWQVVK